MTATTTTSWEPEALWSIPQAAKALGSSYRFVRDRVERGELTAYRLGRLIKVDPAEVLALMTPYPPKAQP